MQIFLSWSGERSKAVAVALKSWLPRVIQAVTPWMSEEDIEKGKRWTQEIADRLSESRFGISCLTPENLGAPWILFEAGAISKTKDALLCPLLLFDLKDADIEGPLSQFNSTKATRDDLKRLIKTINAGLPGVAAIRLDESVLEDAFEANWTRLDDRLREIRNMPEAAPQSERTDRELLEEVLEIVRRQDHTHTTKLHSNDPDRSMTLEQSLLNSIFEVPANASTLEELLARQIRARRLDELMKELRRHIAPQPNFRSEGDDGV